MHDVLFHVLRAIRRLARRSSWKVTAFRCVASASWSFLRIETNKNPTRKGVGGQGTPHCWFIAFITPQRQRFTSPASAIHRVCFLASASFIRSAVWPTNPRFVCVHGAGAILLGYRARSTSPYCILVHLDTSRPWRVSTEKKRKRGEWERGIRAALEIVQRSVTNFRAKRADGLWTNSIVNGCRWIVNGRSIYPGTCSRWTRHLKPPGNTRVLDLMPADNSRRKISRLMNLRWSSNIVRLLRKRRHFCNEKIKLPISLIAIFRD